MWLPRFRRIWRFPSLVPSSAKWMPRSFLLSGALCNSYLSPLSAKVPSYRYIGHTLISWMHILQECFYMQLTLLEGEFLTWNVTIVVYTMCYCLIEIEWSCVIESLHVICRSSSRRENHFLGLIFLPLC